MTRYELVTAIVATLGLLLGAVNTFWMFFSGRPRLRLRSRENSALVSVQFIHENPFKYAPDERAGVVAHVELEIANPSRRDNTVLTVEGQSDISLTPLPNDVRITQGTRIVDLARVLGPGHTLESPVVWTVPTPLWSALLPRALDAGGCAVGHLVYEVQNGETLGDHLIVRVTVRDSHGRRYRKDVCLKRRSTSNCGPTASVAGAAGSETAGSTRTSSISPRT